MDEQQNITSPRPRRGIAAFLAVAFLVPWAGWIAVRAGWLEGAGWETATFAIFPAAASLAGFIAAWVEGGLPRLRSFAKRTLNPFASPMAWVLGLALPLTVTALVFLPRPGDLAGDQPIEWAKLIASVTLLNFFTGPIAEEFGWRGYLLQWFNRKWSILLSGLAIGPIWALWHLPLFYDSVFASAESATGYVLWVTGVSVVLCVVTAMAKGSVLPAILGHWTFNAQASIFSTFFPHLPGEKLPGGLSMGVAVFLGGIAAAFLLARTGRLARGVVATG